MLVIVLIFIIMLLEHIGYIINFSALEFYQPIYFVLNFLIGLFGMEWRYEFALECLLLLFGYGFISALQQLELLNNILAVFFKNAGRKRSHGFFVLGISVWHILVKWIVSDMEYAKLSQLQEFIFILLIKYLLWCRYSVP